MESEPECGDTELRKNARKHVQKTNKHGQVNQGCAGECRVSQLFVARRRELSVVRRSAGGNFYARQDASCESELH